MVQTANLRPLLFRGHDWMTLEVPNWDSTTDQVEIFWNDFDSLNF